MMDGPRNPNYGQKMVDCLELAAANGDTLLRAQIEQRHSAKAIATKLKELAHREYIAFAQSSRRPYLTEKGKQALAIARSIGF
jgi:hypothetical protein